MNGWLYLVNCGQAVVKFTTGVVKSTAKVTQSKFGPKLHVFLQVFQYQTKYQTKYTNNSVHHQNSWSSQFCSGSYMFFSREKLRELWLGISTFVSTAVQNPECFSFCGQMTFRNYHRNNHQNSLIIFETTSLNFVSVRPGQEIPILLDLGSLEGLVSTYSATHLYWRSFGLTQLLFWSYLPCHHVYQSPHSCPCFGFWNPYSLCGY